MTREQEIATEALCLERGGFAIAKQQLVVDCAHGHLFVVDENGKTTQLERRTTRTLPQLYRDVYEGST